MNRQRNSCLSEKGYTSCCTDPGFVSQIGVQLVSERGWTVDLWRQGCTEHWITLRPSWKIHAFPSAPMCDKGLCFPLFHHLFFLWGCWVRDTYRIWVTRISCIFFSPSTVVFLGFGLSMRNLPVLCIPMWVFSMYAGPTGPDWPVCPVLNWLSRPSGVDASHMITVRKVYSACEPHVASVMPSKNGRPSPNTTQILHFWNMWHWLLSKLTKMTDKRDKIGMPSRGQYCLLCLERKVFERTC